MDDTELELLELVLPSSGRPEDDIATLKPAFNPAILRYTAVVASSVQEVEVDSFTADKYATTSIIGRTSELSRVVKLRQGKATLIKVEVTAADGIATAVTTITVTRLSRDCTQLGGLNFLLDPPDTMAAMTPAYSPLTSRYTIDIPAHSEAITLLPFPLDEGASVATAALQLTVKDVAPGTSKAIVVQVLAADGINTGTTSVLIVKVEPKIRVEPVGAGGAGGAGAAAASQLYDPLTLSILAHPTRLNVTAESAAAAALGRPHERIDRSLVLSTSSARYLTRTCKESPLSRIPLATVSFVPDTVSMGSLHRLQVRCPYSRYGCKVTELYAKLSAHMSKCECTPVVDMDSGLVVARRDLVAAADLAAAAVVVAGANMTKENGTGAGAGAGAGAVGTSSGSGTKHGGGSSANSSNGGGKSVGGGNDGGGGDGGDGDGVDGDSDTDGSGSSDPVAAAAEALGITLNAGAFVPKRYAMEKCKQCKRWVRCWEIDAHQEDQCPAILQHQPLPLFRFVPSDAHGRGLLDSEANSWEGLLTDQTLIKGSPLWTVLLKEANRVETAYLVELRRKVKKGRALAQDAHAKAGDGSLLRLLTELVALIATAITYGATGAEVHHRLGAAIEERGHARELFESTVYDDGAYKFGLADDWQSSDAAADLDSKIGGEAGAKELIASVCKRHGINARDSAYVVLRALDREEQVLRSEGWHDRALTVIKVRNWKSRSLAKSMHRRQAGAAAVTDRISGRNALTSDMCIDALGSRNFQTTARPATQKYHEAAVMDRLDPVYTFNLGRMLLAQNMYSEAVSCLRGAVGLRSSFVEARFTLGIALAKAFDVEGPGGSGGGIGGGRNTNRRNASAATRSGNETNGNELPAEVVDYLQDGLDLLVFRANHAATTGEGALGSSTLLSQDMLRASNPMVLDGLLMLCRILYQGKQFEAADNACRDSIPLIVTVLETSLVTTSPTFKLAERVLFEIHLIAASTMVGLRRSATASTMAVQAGAMLLSSRIADSPPCLAIKEQLMQLACRCTPSEVRAVACGDAQLRQYDSSPYHKMEKHKLIEAACSYRAALELILARHEGEGGGKWGRGGGWGGAVALLHPLATWVPRPFRWTCQSFFSCEINRGGILQLLVQRLQSHGRSQSTCRLGRLLPSKKQW